MSYQSKSFHKFIATAATATLVATVIAPVAMASSFTDVSDKYQDAVDFVVDMGANGISSTKFGVHSNIKRVDAAILLVNVLGLDIENAKPSGFTDVPERAVKHINALKEAGITSGKTNKKFDPHSLITRGELAVWIQRGFELEAYSEVPFTDVPSQYEEAVSALVDYEITSGVSNTKFGTYQNAKRGDYALFLMRAFDAVFEFITVSDIKLKEVTPLTGTYGITAGDQNVELKYSLYDQFEDEIFFDAHKADEDEENDVEYIEGVEFTSTNPEVIDIDTLEIDEEGVATLDVGTKEGTTEIIATIPETNVVSKVKVTVAGKINVEDVINTAGSHTGNLTVKPTGVEAITYGPSEGVREVNGNLLIDGSANGTVYLRNVHVNGKVIMNTPNARVVLDETSVVNGTTTVQDISVSSLASSAQHNGEIVVQDANGAGVELSGKASTATVQIDTTGNVSLKGSYNSKVVVNESTTIAVDKEAELQDLQLNKDTVVAGEGRIQMITGTGVPTLQGVSVVTGTYDNVKPEVTEASIRVNANPQLFVDFKINENIDLSPKSKGTVEVIYQAKDANGEFKQVYKKDKTFSGYLNSDAGVKYGPGLWNDTKYEAILPTDVMLSTSVSDKEWLKNIDNLRVIIRVKDNNGNMSEQEVNVTK